MLDMSSLMLHGKNDFAEASKNLTRYRSGKIILLNQQKNYVERLNIFDNVAQYFNIPSTDLSLLHNYFDGPKLFSDLYLLLDNSAKPCFPCCNKQY